MRQYSKRSVKTIHIFLHIPEIGVPCCEDDPCVIYVSVPQVTISFHHRLLTVPFALSPGISFVCESVLLPLSSPMYSIQSFEFCLQYYRYISSLKAFCVISECPSRFISSQQQLRCRHSFERLLLSQQSQRNRGKLSERLYALIDGN
jgi:hypothetical protein